MIYNKKNNTIHYQQRKFTCTGKYNVNIKSRWTENAKTSLRKLWNKSKRYVTVKNVIVMYQPVFCRDVWPELSLPPLSSPRAVLSAGTGCPSEDDTRHHFTKGQKEKQQRLTSSIKLVLTNFQLQSITQYFSLHWGHFSLCKVSHPWLWVDLDFKRNIEMKTARCFKLH